METEDAFSSLNKVLFRLHDGSRFTHEIGHVDSHGNGECQSCGTDTRKVDVAFQIIVYVHMEPLRVPIRTQTAVLCNAVADIDARNQPLYIFKDAAESVCRHGFIGLIIQILRRRPHQHIAMDGRTHQFALGHLSRNRKYNLVYLAVCILIQDVELASSGCHLIIRLSNHCGNLIAVEGGGVNDIVGRDGSSCGNYFFYGSVFGPDVRHLCVQKKVHPVFVGILSQRLHKDKGIDDTLPWDIESPLHLRVQVWLHPAKFFSRFVFHVIDTV